MPSEVQPEWTPCTRLSAWYADQRFPGSMSRKRRYIRYLILLLILFAVAAQQALIKLRVASWEQTLVVRIYAINGDHLSGSARYIDSLKLADFKPIERFINSEARRYGIPIDAIRLEYARELETLPPQPPLAPGMLDNIIWSLHFRAWALYWSFTDDDNNADINLFVNFFDIDTTQSLRHSVGLRGGMIGLINAFAHTGYSGSNNVVITHEIMHTLGASDKYDQSNLPLHPGGYAEPYRQPLYPQRKAEIMGGRIPVSATQVRMPENLNQVIVGAFTANEINWYNE